MMNVRLIMEVFKHSPDWKVVGEGVGKRNAVGEGISDAVGEGVGDAVGEGVGDVSELPFSASVIM